MIILSTSFIVNANIQINDNKDLFNGKEYRALLIGINNYPGTHNDVPFSINEITVFKNTLLNTSNWKEENIIMLTDLDANNQNLENELNLISQQSDDDDLFLFYFAGHGGKNTSSEEYIRLFDEKITDNELDGLLDDINGRQIVILDCCYSGGFLTELKQNNRVILTACRGDEETYQDFNFRSGIFGYYFNLALSRITKTAELSFFLASIFTVRYTKKLSEDYQEDYTTNPMMSDGKFGFLFIITFRKIFASKINIDELMYTQPGNTRLWKL